MSQTPEKMSLAEFEERLPEFFNTGTGKISEDARLHVFLKENPDSAALVRDLEYIGEQARKLFTVEDDVDPSDDVWVNIQSELNAAQPDGEAK